MVNIKHAFGNRAPCTQTARVYLARRYKLYLDGPKTWESRFTTWLTSYTSRRRLRANAPALPLQKQPVSPKIRQARITARVAAVAMSTEQHRLG
jgi:hypothetical protein